MVNCQTETLDPNYMEEELCVRLSCSNRMHEPVSTVIAKNLMSQPCSWKPKTLITHASFGPCNFKPIQTKLQTCTNQSNEEREEEEA